MLINILALAERQDFLIPPGIDVVGAYAVQGGEDSQAAINKLINEARRAAVSKFFQLFCKCASIAG